jgi:hypothetical protein
MSSRKRYAVAAWLSRATAYRVSCAQRRRSRPYHRCSSRYRSIDVWYGVTVGSCPAPEWNEGVGSRLSTSTFVWVNWCIARLERLQHFLFPVGTSSSRIKPSGTVLHEFSMIRVLASRARDVTRRVWRPAGNVDMHHASTICYYASYFQHPSLYTLWKYAST